MTYSVSILKAASACELLKPALRRPDVRGLKRHVKARKHS